MAITEFPCEFVPDTLLDIAAPPSTWPLPIQSRRHWPDTAYLLERLLNEPDINVATLHFPTLQALYGATAEYIVQEDIDDEIELTDELIQDFNANPWTLVLDEGGLVVDVTRLPRIPWVYDVFY